MTKMMLAAALALLAAPALADGDADDGEALFNRQCTSCHLIANGAGEVLAGRSAHTGPNLFGVVGRTIGTEEGFNYSDAMVAAGVAGMVWDEELFVGYVQDPTEWLRTTLSDPRARAKMAFRVRSSDEAEDLYAYLSGFTE